MQKIPGQSTYHRKTLLSIMEAFLFLCSNFEMSQTFMKINTLKMFSGLFLNSSITIFQLLFSKISFPINRADNRMERNDIMF